MKLIKLTQTLFAGLLLATNLLTGTMAHAQDTIKIGGNLELSGSLRNTDC